MKIPFSYQAFSALLPDETRAIAYYTEQHWTYFPTVISGSHDL